PAGAAPRRCFAGPQRRPVRGGVALCDADRTKADHSRRHSRGSTRHHRPRPRPSLSAMPDLKPLLSPDSVAVIGASADTEPLRGRLTHALIGHGYDGRVFPVTRSQSEVLGLRAYPTVAELTEAVDLAVILVPAAHVVDTLEQCGARGVRAAVVISSGF